jgi:hypothetical protein
MYDVRLLLPEVHGIDGGITKRSLADPFLEFIASLWPFYSDSFQFLSFFDDLCESLSLVFVQVA